MEQADHTSYEHLKMHLHERLIEQLEPRVLNQMSPEKKRLTIVTRIEQLLDEQRVLATFGQRKQLIGERLDEMLGLGPLEKVLADPSISDILVNGPNQVYVERRGRLERFPIRFRDDDHLLEIIHRIVNRVNRRVDESSPMVDARLPDGSRVNAIIPPVAAGADAVDSPVRYPSSDAPGSTNPQGDHARDAPVSGGCHSCEGQRADQRRHRVGQDHPVELALGLHPAR
jgi:hypothetical protein